MVERRRIVDMWRRGQATALATLVHVKGSSYRATGARLLVGQNGAYAGAVSGGCLEAEIVRKAPWLVRHGAVVERYSTLFDDTAEVPYGLGCGGTVEVLLEPAATPECEALFQALAASLAGDWLTITTQLPQASAPLTRSIRRLDGGVVHSSPGIVPSETAPSGVTPSFTEILEPPQRLFLFGAGDGAQPVVQMASLLGWRVIVMDSRTSWAKVSRFPEAHAVLAADTLAHTRPTSRDAVVLMTHSFEQDRSWLEQVLPCEPRYIGLLGSRHRSALLVAEAAFALGWDLEKVCGRLFSPVGLDLGGDGAEAIALSIVSEVQACVQGKLGHSRRMSAATVREQVALGGASRYLQVQCAL